MPTGRAGPVPTKRTAPWNWGKLAGVGGGSKVRPFGDVAGILSRLSGGVKMKVRGSQLWGGWVWRGGGGSWPRAEARALPGARFGGYGNTLPFLGSVWSLVFCLPPFFRPPGWERF